MDIIQDPFIRAACLWVGGFGLEVDEPGPEGQAWTEFWNRSKHPNLKDNKSLRIESFCY